MTGNVIDNTVIKNIIQIFSQSNHANVGGIVYEYSEIIISDECIKVWVSKVGKYAYLSTSLEFTFDILPREMCIVAF